MASITDNLPSLDDLWTEAKAIWASERPDASQTPRSDVWLQTWLAAKAWYRLHQTAARVLDALFYDTTYGIYLDRLLKLFRAPDGSGDYGLVVTRGSTGGEVTITGTAGSSVAIGDQLTDASGLTYQLTEAHNWAANGDYDTDCEAVSTGSATNLDVGETLTFVSAPPGITAATTVATALTGGADDETDADGRARLAARVAPASSGTWRHWQTVIEDASPGVLRGYVWPARESQPYGTGRVDYLALDRTGSGTSMHIGAADALYTTISDAVADEDTGMPALSVVNSRELIISAVSQAIDITLEMADNADESQLSDADMESVQTTVASSTVSTKTIDALADVCSPTVTDGLEVGDRVVINDGEAIVASVNVGADAKVFTVSSWPSEWGAADNAITGDSILAGGGVIKAVVDALRALGDSLGPAKGSYAAPIPGWEDTLRLTAIKTAVIQATDGAVVDMTITTPAADVAPTAGSGTTTERIVVTEIRVWEPK